MRKKLTRHGPFEQPLHIQTTAFIVEVLLGGPFLQALGETLEAIALNLIDGLEFVTLENQIKIRLLYPFESSELAILRQSV